MRVFVGGQWGQERGGSARWPGRILAWLLLALPGSALAQATSNEDVPEELRVKDGPQACHARAYFPTTHQPKKVLVTPEHVQTRRVPAVTKEVEQDVEVTPQTRVKKTVPAITKEVVETVIVTPETTREVVQPAVYEKRTRRVLVEAAKSDWVRTYSRNGAALQPVRGAGGQAVTGCETAEKARTNKDCEALIPSQEVYELQPRAAKYKDVVEDVLIRPEQKIIEKVPAVTRQVTRTVIVQPEQVLWETRPAVIQKVKRTLVVQPERVETIVVPAVYSDETQASASRGEAVWRRVVCSRDVSAYLVSQVQLALATNGYNPREFDGQLGRETQSALERFQYDNGLPAGPLSLETLKLLGVMVR